MRDTMFHELEWACGSKKSDPARLVKSFNAGTRLPSGIDPFAVQGRKYPSLSNPSAACP
jgi:hypothetical protein